MRKSLVHVWVPSWFDGGVVFGVLVVLRDGPNGLSDEDNDKVVEEL